jgi:hypothetical protein
MWMGVLYAVRRRGWQAVFGADPSDNVATLLDEETELDRLSDGMRIAEQVPFGHKVSLRPIAVGEAIVKYGVEIGSCHTGYRTGRACTCPQLPIVPIFLILPAVSNGADIAALMAGWAFVIIGSCCLPWR